MTPSRRARRSIALAGLATLTLTGCGAGLDAQTNQRRTYSEGANVTAENGQILIRNFYLAPPDQEAAEYEPGDDARAYTVIVNQGDADDRLVSASSPVADDVTFWSGGDPEAGVAEHTEEFVELFEETRDARPGGTDNRTLPGEAADEGAATPSAEVTPGPEESPAAAAAEDGQRFESFDIPQGDKLEILPGAGYLLFEGLRETVYPGTTVEVTLEFEQAGPVTFPAYVHVLGEPAERETPGSELEGTNERGSDSTADLEAGT